VPEQLIDVAEEHEYVGAQLRGECTRDRIGVAVERFRALVQSDGIDDGRETGRPQRINDGSMDQGAWPTRSSASPTDSEQSSVASDPQRPTLANPASLSAATMRTLTSLRAITT